MLFLKSHEKQLLLGAQYFARQCLNFCHESLRDSPMTVIPAGGGMQRVKTVAPSSSWQSRFLRETTSGGRNMGEDAIPALVRLTPSKDAWKAKDRSRL